MAEHPKASHHIIMNSDKSIAIVALNKAERRSLNELLTSEGFPVEAFSPGEESLHALDPAKYGCLIVDLDHSGGYPGEQTLIDSAKEWSRELPVIVTASHSTQLPRHPQLPTVAKSAGETRLLYLVYGALSQSTPLIA
jgi:DNA-binding NtrC family response regulator